MFRFPLPDRDLWKYLQTVQKPILLYGMGNGADKILHICERHEIVISDFFASDGFVRGHQFHGKTVMTYSAAREKYGDGNFIILVSFATRLPEVMETIQKIAAENELYIPDVPVFGEEVFDLSFATAHRQELEQAEQLLYDDESKRVFETIIRYRLTGQIEELETAVTSPHAVMREILHPQNYQTTLDLGAYNGDTVRELLNYAPNLKTVYAMEPDARNFRKLSEYAEKESACHVIPVNACAWNRKEVLLLDASGNRNANVSSGNPLNATPHKTKEINALPPDEIAKNQKIDYIKYDVEGSERQALEGSLGIISRHRPELLISLYHRSGDLFRLPLFLKQTLKDYRFYLRRFPYYPAWDLNLYLVPNK